jgi:hypothetical protein
MSTNAKHGKALARSRKPKMLHPIFLSAAALEAAREAPSRHGIVPLSTRSSRTCLSFSVSIWTPEAFVLECHELVGFDQSLSVFSRTRPGCANSLKYNLARHAYEIDLTLEDLRSGPSELDGEAFDWGDRSPVYRHPQYWTV